MKTTEYLNAPIKSCDNCAYQRLALNFDSKTNQQRFADCTRSGKPCGIEREFPSQCDRDFSGWRPRPPEPTRRSLRKWLYDTLIA